MVSTHFFILELTPLCNSKCSFCYNVWKEEPCSDSNINFLRFDKYKEMITKLLSELKDFGISPSGIALSGGEVLLHPDFLQLAKHISEQNIRINIASNGTLLSPDIIKKLSEYGVRNFELSLPSLDDHVYKEITGSDLSKVKAAMLSIKSTSQSILNVAFTIIRQNYREIGTFIDLCFAFSVDSIMLNRFVPGGKSADKYDTFALTREELKEALQIANDKAGSHNITILITIPIEDCIISHSNYPNLRFSSCLCGLNKWVIDPLGNLRICEQNPEILGNIFSNNTIDLMKSNQVTDFREDDLKAECTTCKSYRNCKGGCRFSPVCK
ncbi:MAG: radical SAM protein [Candidatus Brocadiaceae bacterium]|nr:radical SAM protein [Candidatus Brocadiaceae bacterium]